MRIKRISWADGTPSDSYDLSPETKDDLAYLNLRRLRLLDVGEDFIRAARARTLEARLRSILPRSWENGPLSAAEGLALLRLGPGMRP